MSFKFKTKPVANPANPANHEPPTVVISKISNPGTSLKKTPDPQISRISNVRSLRDNKKGLNNNNNFNENIRSPEAANPANPANRKRLYELCAQATDGIKLPDGRRITPAMFVKRLTADDIAGIVCGDYGLPLLRCALESMAQFPREFDPENKS